MVISQPVYNKKLNINNRFCYIYNTFCVIIKERGEIMEVIYINNDQIVNELKKLMIDKGITQKEIADKLGIKPQAITKIFNKKNLGFEDVKKILEVMECEFAIEFKDK